MILLHQFYCGIYILGLPASYPENVAQWATNELINKSAWVPDERCF
jgi:hypothetical protein